MLLGFVCVVFVYCVNYVVCLLFTMLVLWFCCVGLLFGLMVGCDCVLLPCIPGIAVSGVCLLFRFTAFW